MGQYDNLNISTKIVVDAKNSTVMVIATCYDLGQEFIGTSKCRDDMVFDQEIETEIAKRLANVQVEMYVIDQLRHKRQIIPSEELERRLKDLREKLNRLKQIYSKDPKEMLNTMIKDIENEINTLEGIYHGK